MLVVGDEHGRDADLELEPSDLVAERLAHLRVERGQRLVEQEHLRRRGDGPGEGHPLLLAARHLVRVLVGVLLQPRHLDHPVDDRRALGCGPLLDLEPEVDVLAGGHVREQAVVLEHHPELALLRRVVDDVPALDLDHAAVGLLEAGEDAQRGRLAAAARAEQAHQLARSRSRA